MDIISLFSLAHRRQSSGFFFSLFLSLFFFFLKREIEIENHKQERDKHMEGKAKRKHMTKSGETQTVLDNYIWSDKETWMII